MEAANGRASFSLERLCLWSHQAVTFFLTAPSVRTFVYLYVTTFFPWLLGDFTSLWFVSVQTSRLCNLALFMPSYPEHFGNLSFSDCLIWDWGKSGICSLSLPYFSKTEHNFSKNISCVLGLSLLCLLFLYEQAVFHVVLSCHATKAK